jgi:RimJ/RimL family protein N-acetyltransferase
MTEVVELPTAVEALVLRSLTPADAALVADFHAANAERLIRHSPGSDPPPSDVATVEAMLAALADGQLMLGLWLHDELIGVEYLVFYEDEPSGVVCAGLGYGIDERYEGLGYSTAAVEAMTSYAIAELGVPLVTALTAVENVGSRRVLEKVGFTLVSEADGWLRYQSPPR